MIQHIIFGYKLLLIKKISYFRPLSAFIDIKIRLCYNYVFNLYNINKYFNLSGA
jgi:hypothetical protein